jgi:metal-responsive CopG/Arc/MetJ family transcriptional regulator
MERIQASLPNPLHEKVDKFEQSYGYESQSAAVRKLIREGLRAMQDRPHAGRTTPAGGLEMSPPTGPATDQEPTDNDGRRER